jgi:His-Xaa-Ser system protein HxsD
MKKNNKQKRPSKMVFKIDPKIYPLEVVKAAAYAFVNRAYVDIGGNAKRKILVTLTDKENSGRKELERIAGDFKNELLNYALRRDISQNNREIREYIVSRALFSSVTPPEKEFEIIKNKAREAGKKGRRAKVKKGDFIDDPLGIAVPWEEKFGNQ